MNALKKTGGGHRLSGELFDLLYSRARSHILDILEYQAAASPEAGSLLEFQRLAEHSSVHYSALRLGHIIRVWLQLPQQALFFYDQALRVGTSNA